MISLQNERNRFRHGTGRRLPAKGPATALWGNRIGRNFVFKLRFSNASITTWIIRLDVFPQCRFPPRDFHRPRVREPVSTTRPGRLGQTHRRSGQKRNEKETTSHRSRWGQRKVRLQFIADGAVNQPLSSHKGCQAVQNRIPKTCPVDAFHLHVLIEQVS